MGTQEILVKDFRLMTILGIAVVFMLACGDEGKLLEENKDSESSTVDDGVPTSADDDGETDENGDSGEDFDPETDGDQDTKANENTGSNADENEDEDTEEERNTADDQDTNGDEDTHDETKKDSDEDTHEENDSGSSSDKDSDTDADTDADTDSTPSTGTGIIISSDTGDDSDTGDEVLCGGEVCADGYDCCGPPECGYCVHEMSGVFCPSSCQDTDSETPSDDTERQYVTCPETVPVAGSGCDETRLSCEYGDSPFPRCRTRAYCNDDNVWQITEPSDAMCDGDPFATPCPEEREYGDACVTAGDSCASLDGYHCICVDVECIAVCSVMDPPEWRCFIPPERDCPAYPPNDGTRCEIPAGETCRYQCHGATCCNAIYTCQEDGSWSGPHDSCSELDCNAPDTPIGTPNGERPIAELLVGDLVYSMHNGAIKAVPIIEIGSKPQVDHEVMEVILANGITLEISPTHPTAEGKVFGDLMAGDTLDGQEILSAKRVAYTHSHTFDILPGSDTGTYLAGGALIGSTLAR